MLKENVSVACASSWKNAFPRLLFYCCCPMLELSWFYVHHLHGTGSKNHKQWWWFCHVIWSEQVTSCVGRSLGHQTGSWGHDPPTTEHHNHHSGWVSSIGGRLGFHLAVSCHVTSPTTVHMSSEAVRAQLSAMPSHILHYSMQSVTL